jgi:hypothetical protein
VTQSFKEEKQERKKSRGNMEGWCREERGKVMLEKAKIRYGNK